MSDKYTSFQDKELDILREAVDKVEKKSGKAILNSPEVKKIINIVERFISRKKLICYGGTAINNILPVKDQFYDKTVELPDYDFFSPNALDDAKELADIYAKHGYTDVEAKAGVHKGTFKVFVNFIPVADITDLDDEIYNILSKESIIVKGIKYTPPNYLRMSMYLELSRPDGDVSRWEKILKRLILLNKNFPLKNKFCDSHSFMRDFEGDRGEENTIYTVVRDTLIDSGLVFFGGYASSLYSRYMPRHRKQQLKHIPDFDVLSENAKDSADLVKERLRTAGIKHVVVRKKEGVGENIPIHYEVIVHDDTVCFIYEPSACHSYNTIRVKGKTVKIATIDTMLSFYLAFLYSKRPYYDHERIVCMAQYLFEIQAKNRLEQKGLLKRFSITCYGKQKTLADFREAKTKKFEELQNKRNTREYEEYFLRYIPNEKQSVTKKRGNKKKDKTVKKGRSRVLKKNKVGKTNKSRKKKAAKKYWML